VANAPSGNFNCVSAGETHSCEVGPDGALACWRYGSAGQTSHPNGTFSKVCAGGITAPKFGPTVSSIADATIISSRLLLMRVKPEAISIRALGHLTGVWHRLARCGRGRIVQRLDHEKCRGSRQNGSLMMIEKQGPVVWEGGSVRLALWTPEAE
jgi:hypothetical protein